MDKVALSYDDVLLIPRKSNLTSRSQVDIGVQFCGQKYSAPIVMSPMTCVTSPQMIHYFCKQRLIPTMHRYFQKAQDQYDYVYIGLAEQILLQKNNIHPFDWENRVKLRNNTITFDDISQQLHYQIGQVYFAIGSVIKWKQWIDYLLSKGVRKFCIDMAHGHSKPCIDTIKYLRSIDEDIKIMAGNIATSQAYKELSKCGVDSLRCSIGSGAACTTRSKCGFGVPMITCLQDINKIKNENTYIVADGGIKQTGDMIKCMYFGSDVVMLGKMLAATDLSAANNYNKDQKLINRVASRYQLPPRYTNRDVQNLVVYKQYLGMASKKARNGVLQEGSIQGVSGLIKYNGTTEDLINNIKKNMKSALSYGGVKNWEQLREKVKYNIISNASIIESMTHLDITKER